MLPRITTLLLVAAALLLTPFAGSAEDKDGWISLFLSLIHISEPTRPY